MTRGAAKHPALLEIGFRELGRIDARDPEPIPEEPVTEVPRVHLVAGRVRRHDVPPGFRGEARTGGPTNAREERLETDPTADLPHGKARLCWRVADPDEKLGLARDRVHYRPLRLASWGNEREDIIDLTGIEGLWDGAWIQTGSAWPAKVWPVVNSAPSLRKSMPSRSVIHRQRSAPGSAVSEADRESDRKAATAVPTLITHR